MVLKSRHETRDTRHETTRYDCVCAVIAFRILSEAFDYNLRFLILIVPYDSARYSTVPHVVPRALYPYSYEYKWAARRDERIREVIFNP